MDKTIGFAMCGSFCTLSRVIDEIYVLKKLNYNIIPIMSEIAYSTDTRFGKADEIVEKVEKICGQKIIHTIAEAEPIGPKKMLDLLIVAPCTGNTLAKLSNGITDTTVTMAAKSHLRNNKPVLIGVSTNDGLGASAKNIGHLLNFKNIYFVPFGQDDCNVKGKSLVADFSLIPDSVSNALKGIQLQPIIF